MSKHIGTESGLALLAAGTLLLVALCTSVLRTQVTAEGYRLAASKQQRVGLSRRLAWLELQLGRQLARLPLEPAPERPGLPPRELP